jgi:CheY-like chemotaxis protein
VLKSSPVKLLVVDDHAAFRQTVRQMFDASAAEIIEAGSGEEALKVFAAARPDWVIMDMRMPGMGGIKATEAIRKLNPHARVIVISQFTEAEFREQARHAGAVEFLDKEKMSQLTEIIQGHRPQP